MSSPDTALAEADESTEHDPIDTGWRVVASVQDRIGAVDSKAGICLSLELGVLTAAAALAGAGTVQISAAWTLVFLAGAACLSAAVLAAISVIMPRTRSRQVGDDMSGDLLFFANLSALRPAELAARLRSVDLVDELARQAVHTSVIALAKHRRLQLSLHLATAGLLLVAAAAIIGGLTA